MEARTKTSKARYGDGTIRKYLTSTGVRYRAWVYLGLFPAGRTVPAARSQR